MWTMMAVSENREDLQIIVLYSIVVDGTIWGGYRWRRRTLLREKFMMVVLFLDLGVSFLCVEIGQDMMLDFSWCVSPSELLRCNRLEISPSQVQ